MGMFDFMFSPKAGKGVERDEPKRHPFIQFWKLVWRKLSRLIAVNALYFIVILPLIVLVYMFFNSALGLQPGQTIETDGEAATLIMPGFLLVGLFSYIPEPVFYGLCVVSAVLFGPATCGFTYVLRNFAREEHAWISDFWSKAKANFTVGLKLGLIEVVAVILIALSLSAGGAANTEELSGMTQLMFTASRYISVMVVALLLCIHYYLYTMAVTFEMKAFHILKNSLIFAVVGMWRNLLTLAVFAVIAVLLFLSAGMLAGLLEIILLAMIFLSLGGFAAVFIQYPLIRKHMLDPQLEKENTDV
ncbi:MAG: DUF624 domain-containing protein [Oscillospiraceae bacterium]|jgi:uncharacterized membrane protein YesL|nr:DUF624 domain-containing protein [Oscillospiraceae bacterium]